MTVSGEDPWPVSNQERIAMSQVLEPSMWMAVSEVMFTEQDQCHEIQEI